MNKLFEFLDNKSLVQDSDFNQLRNWNKEKLTEFILDIERLDLNEKNNSSSVFSFSANEELSSGKNPCYNIKCRLKKINELVQFAILYSDNVFIYNPFEKFIPIREWNKYAKEELVNDLIVINYLKPLINKNIIRIAHGKEVMCKNCRAKFLAKFDDLSREIEDSIVKTSEITLLKKENKYALRIIGNGDVFGHESVTRSLRSNPKYKKYFQGANSYKLNENDITDFKVAKHRAEEIIFDLVRQDANVKTFDNNYLLANNYYAGILDKINNSKTNVLTPYTFVNGLSHAVPAIENTNIHNLISLRENDYESFLVYRDSIRELIRETFEKKEFVDFNSAFNDIVLPEINKINLAVKKNKKLLSYNTTKEIVISSGIIGLGVFSGILPPDFGKIFGAIGGCKFAHAIISQLIDLKNPEYNILDNKYYFIWKMNQELNK